MSLVVDKGGIGASGCRAEAPGKCAGARYGSKYAAAKLFIEPPGSS
jgi:hypothetical protein